MLRNHRGPSTPVSTSGGPVSTARRRIVGSHKIMGPNKIVTAAVGILLLAATLVGCTPPDVSSLPGRDAPVSDGETASATPTAEPFAATISVDDKASDVPVDTLLTVSADSGTITQVKVSGAGTDSKGKKVSTTVPGRLGSDGTWKASERLDPDTKYTVTATGQPGDGAEATVTSTFSTAHLSLDEQIYTSIVNQEDSTYGVAMPVVVIFDLPVTDRKAVEKQLSVKTTPEQTGSWGWVSDTEVHWRPKEYFTPGTKVTVTANLNGVDVGGDQYGQNSAETTFVISDKSRITKVDLKKDVLTQYVNGKVVATVPVSGGKPGSETRSGTKVVMEKLAETRMASETVGIANNSADGYDLMVKYAMRITTSGEFLHAAPWNAAYFGNTNASHGCVGMGTADGKELFGIIQVGDPVVVTGTSRKLDDGNGYTDWNVSWDEWQSRSAL